LTFSQVLNKVQIHSCTKQYCIRLNKRTKERLYRFYFPRPNAFEAKITREMNPKHWIYIEKRNDKLVNYFNRILTIFWLTNTNIALCTDINTVINYIDKYCSKAEKSTESYTNIIRQILPKVNPNHSKLSL